MDRLELQTPDLTRALRRIENVQKQARFAQARALNSTAFDLRARIQERMRAVFDRPTPYIVDSIWVGKKADPESLEAWVYPRERGGKGVDPARVLLAQVTGGRRRAKRFEVALQRIGVLPAGMGTVPAKWVVASHGDGFGNVKGSFIVRLLSYLQAFGEQGYRANMSEKKRKAIAKTGRRFQNGQVIVRGGLKLKGLAQIRGVEYFVSMGPGEWTGRRSWRNGKRQHLARGIWQRSGIHGSDVKPVFLFVPLPAYSKRLDLPVLAREVVAERYPQHFEAEFARALASAR